MAPHSLDLASDLGCYSPLGESQIRILQLKPRIAAIDEEGNSGLPFSLSFELISLSQSHVPSFVALSYAWGSEPAAVPIEVSGLNLRITRNLYTILQTLGINGAPECLWVDAICINQSNFQECADQVRLMRGIYARAAFVAVFLSAVSSPFDLGLSFLERVANHPEEHYDPLLTPYVSIHGFTLHSEELRDSFVAFFAAPWWTRLWTVQEFALARKVCFICGTRTIDRETVAKAFNNMRHHECNCCWAPLRTIGGYPRGYLDMPSAANGGLSVFGAVARWYHLGTITEAEFYDIHDLLGAITTFRQRRCSDPRDRIYGMLGLKLRDERAQNVIQTSYTIPAKDLFRNVTLIFIEQSETLDVLGHVLPPTLAQPTIDRLPSWVPDWNAQLDVNFHLVHSERTRYKSNYCASGKAKPNWVLLNDSEIATEALLLGQIVADTVGYPMETSSLCGKLLLDEWRAMFEAPGKLQESVDIAGVEEEKSEESFSSFISGDLKLIKWIEEPSKFSLLQTYQSWNEWFTSENPTAPATESRSDIREFDNLVKMNTLGRRFYATDNGWVGFGPENLRVGDHLAVIPGGRKPYVLRRTCARNDGVYTLLGDAYARGAMEGQAMGSGQDLAKITIR